MVRLKSLRICIVLAVTAVALAACGNPPQQPPISPTAIPIIEVRITPTPAPTETPSPTPTATFTPTPTPHPLTIQSMRERQYPGSDIVIEETLTPGSNYSRYLVSYLSEGFKIYALMTVPFGEKPATGWPVIIFNHGFIPPAQYRTTERYVAYVDWLARSGYIVFRSDYRGHGNSEGDPRGAYGSPDYVVDVLNAVAAMKRHPDADPNRIGMWGHSMGGYITLRSMVINPEIRAGVIWAGVVGSYTDLVERWRRTPTPSGGTPQPTFTPRPGRRWRAELIEQYGPPEENPAFWNSISANAYLAELSGPVQLHHGTADRSVPIEFSERLYQQISDAGKTAEYYSYEGDDHNIATSFGLAMQRTIEFFDRYLKGQ